MNFGSKLLRSFSMSGS